MVLVATPMHDIACPIVFIEHRASLPDFLEEAIAEIAERYARTLLPEYSVYKYAPVPSNLVDEIKALASTEDIAKYSITSAGDSWQTLAELPGPGKALIHQLENATTSSKPRELKKQAPVFKSLLPRGRLERTLATKTCSGPFILSEPILDLQEANFIHNKTVRIESHFPFYWQLQKINKSPCVVKFYSCG